MCVGSIGLISQLQASNNGARWLIQQALLMGSDLKSEFGNHCTSKFRRKVSGRLTKGMVNLLPLFKRFIAKFKYCVFVVCDMI